MHIKILKRNQIIISVIALMLITVGYMNYSSNISKAQETSAQEAEKTEFDGTEMAGIGDAKLVNGQEINEVISEDERINRFR